MEATAVRFTPRTEKQKALVQSIWQNDITLVSGSPGTGKTGLSIQTLVEMLKRKDIRKIIVIRLVADTCDEHIGALPGEKDEKLAAFMGPVLDNLSQILPPNDLEYLLEKKQLEVLPVSHARGRTFADCGVLIEEAQNLTEQMLLTLVTRIGEGCKMVINGDPYQVDFRGRNGIVFAYRLLKDIEGVGTVHLDDANIQRHPIIKAILERARAIGNEAL